MTYIILFFVTILQNASFTLVSRARNSKSLVFHAIASVFSNGIWFIVVRQVTQEDPNTWLLGTVYVAGTVTGSVAMHYLSMNFIEKWFEKPFTTTTTTSYKDYRTTGPTTTQPK